MNASSHNSTESIDKLSHELLDAFDNLFGMHPGFRPVHAKGIFCAGIFTPSAQARNLTRAPHAHSASTPVVIRFSDFAGLPMVADNDSNGASPRGIGLRFYLGEHVHTDIVAHSHNGFPTRNGEEFLEFAKALATSGPDSPKPTAIEQFLASHPETMKFVHAAKPVPTSFARENFFAVCAFKFTNAEKVSRFGRFKILPELGAEYSSQDELANKTDNFLFEELKKRFDQGSIKFKVIVQLATDTDIIDDATEIWPDDREIIDFGSVELFSEVPPTDLEVQKIIFDPIPRVDGIEPSEDPLIAVRAAVYLLSGRRRRAAVAAANSR